MRVVSGGKLEANSESMSLNGHFGTENRGVPNISESHFTQNAENVFEHFLRLKWGSLNSPFKPTLTQW